VDVRTLLRHSVVYTKNSGVGRLEVKMPSFSARLHLPGTRLPLSVEVDISDERMRLTAGDREVADWPMADIAVAVQSDGFHLTVDNEEIVLNPTDSTHFAQAIGIADPSLTPNGGSGRASGPLSLDAAELKQLRYQFLKSRVSEIAELITSTSVSPEEVFTQWLKLLKDLNRRHGNGSIPTHVFYELNTELLDLIPQPGHESKTAPGSTPSGQSSPHGVG